MGEFANAVRDQAMDTLRRVYGRAAPIDSDAVVELIAFLLGDETDDPATDGLNILTVDQWIAWTRHLADRPRFTRRMMTNFLDREQAKLPADTNAMRLWATHVVLRTLDRMEAA